MRTIKALTCAAIVAILPAPFALAQTIPNGMGTSITKPGDQAVSRRVTLGVDKSMIVDLEAPAADVVISNPEIADAVVQTAQRIIFRGIKFGQTNALIFDRAGNTLLDLNIMVETDLAALEETISRHIPDARVKIESFNGSVILTGMVDNLSQSDQVSQLVKAFFPESAGGGELQIVNMLNVNAADQVMLEVRIVEMQRSVIKQLGINLSGATSFGELANQTLQQVFQGGLPLFFDPDSGEYNTTGQGTAVEMLQPAGPSSNTISGSASSGFNVQGQALGGISLETGYTNYNNGRLQSSIGAAIDAMERVGIVRTLAEPNIVAMSGESAKFLAGGEFPVPVGQNQNGQITVEFKPYGVGLAFTPVVLSEGRISLKVSTEVSELTSQGAFQGAAQTITDGDGNTTIIQGATLPALSVRRAESVVELPSGGSMMMAGLISVKDRQTIDQLPGLKKLPILGSLFQSRDFLSEETELVVMVTPYLVGATNKASMVTPADGYANASDAKTIFFGKLNETYGRDGAPIKPDDYRAPVGFMEE
ncbi:pilus assembly protein CpaC [Hyphomonas neptunium ATCC 15444]|uniref:Pilus assembly protein CpaC n=2 Tax=Hyphomonas TaxID=85 RepID=Q0BXV2_HYPNA|nr:MULTISPECIES: type II and III secretion system protein family protein [Hyphomonas]ABI77675.1 pilus assembly protein CpaC [Hyphomonas neptunium ATCC 15444]KCZ93618.1 pilus assembly protein CpaC [Hyphomonas hirschiana VP5]